MEKKTPTTKKPAAKRTATVRTAPVKKAAAPHKIAGEKPAIIELSTEGMIRTLGRRKEAVAQVRIAKGTGKITVNGRVGTDYFTVPELRHILTSAQKAVGQDAAIDISVLVKGGGIRGQADATRLGIARALIIMSETFRPTLRKIGFLTRDARVKERKKYGLKSARRAPQFSKR